MKAAMKQRISRCVRCVRVVAATGVTITAVSMSKSLTPSTTNSRSSLQFSCLSGVSIQLTNTTATTGCGKKVIPCHNAHIFMQPLRMFLMKLCSYILCSC